ncbi:CheR family methyltransferase [Corallococcus terminator]|uniref:Protein-glutamate O-methyltransferase CheR n=1 Tax=Corallococcus terminator TaxID=2316733 RepID=A0A3A8HSP1_9BACT|nr:protein-glutamate O-methyltransferase CheR [Corallococcus terminator]RKG74232.1 protein-glutamate O-methyltransferase CheR [Corallococcus terminator]
MIGGILSYGFREVLALVEERAGLAAPSCLAAAEEGIQRAMARANLTDVEAYRHQLAVNNALLDDLLTELTIGETYFFRTHEHFDHLRRVVLPELRERRGPEHLLRAWSAACSSGEEPYSITALLMSEGWEDHMTVHATDVSRTALARAREGRYTDWSLRGPSADRMRAHLKQEGRHYLLNPDVKRHVRLGYLNLALETWPSAESGIWQLDVIFCRNVLIYFNHATIEGVARRLFAALDDGGYLFSGPSDPPLGDYAPFEAVLTDWGVLYRKPLAGHATHFVPLQPLAPLRADGTPFTPGRSGTSADAARFAPASGPSSGSFDASRFASGPVSRPSDSFEGGRFTSAPASDSFDASRFASGAVLGEASGSFGGAHFAPDQAAGSFDSARFDSGEASGSFPVSNTFEARATQAAVPLRPVASAPKPAARFELSVEAREGVRQALARGDWREASKRAGAQAVDPDQALEAVRTLANLEPRAAVFACGEALVRHPLVAGLRYLEALLLLGQARLPDAEKSARQALYLEPGLAVGHLLLGHVLRRQDQSSAAARAYREAEGLCRKLPPEALVPLAEGERAGALADVARAEWRRLELEGGGAS